MTIIDTYLFCNNVISQNSDFSKYFSLSNSRQGTDLKKWTLFLGVFYDEVVLTSNI